MQTVVNEIYGGIWAPPPLPIDEESWNLSWIAIVNGNIIGMVMTHDDWVTDIWVLRESRGHGIGQKLLAKGEAEIFDRGHRAFRLRVLQLNTKAIEFYTRQGWRVARQFPHERFPVMMLKMVKCVL